MKAASYIYVDTVDKELLERRSIDTGRALTMRLPAFALNIWTGLFYWIEGANFHLKGIVAYSIKLTWIMGCLLVLGG